MAATIDIHGIRATIKDYKWQSMNAELERRLNKMLDPLGPSGADPNPDASAAFEVAKLLNGKVINYDETEYVPGVVY